MNFPADSNQRGETLVGLLVGLSLGLLVLTGGAHMLARAQALLHQQHVTVCSASHGVCDPAAGWHSGWLVYVDANRNGQRETDEHMVQQRGATPTAIRITGNSSVNRVIGYGAEGRSESLTGAFQAGTVSVCASGQAQGWQVVINAVGRPRLEKAEMQTCP